MSRQRRDLPHGANPRVAQNARPTAREDPHVAPKARPTVVGVSTIGVRGGIHPHRRSVRILRTGPIRMSRKMRDLPHGDIHPHRRSVRILRTGPIRMSRKRRDLRHGAILHTGVTCAFCARGRSACRAKCATYGTGRYACRAKGATYAMVLMSARRPNNDCNEWGCCVCCSVQAISMEMLSCISAKRVSRRCTTNSTGDSPVG